MTAETIVMNKCAIALAADSVVTIQHRKGKKIYNTSNKLFALSPRHPVGIMIYGKADLMRTPLEIILKEFTLDLGNKKYKTLKSYAERFIRFLHNNTHLIPKIEQDKYFSDTISIIFGIIVKEINDKVQTLITQHGKATYQQIKQTIKDVISNNANKFSQFPDLPHISAVDRNKLIRHYKQIIRKIVRKNFGKLPITKNQRIALEKICAHVFCKSFFVPGSYSGIVVAGYGEHEIFPSFISYNIECLAFNILKYEIYQTGEISFKNQATIQAFAQRDEVSAFMNGIHPIYYQFLKELLTDLCINHYPERVANRMSKNSAVRQNAANLIRTINRSLIDKIINSMRDYEMRKFWGPIVQVVTVLPIDELAIMAETFVNLTSFKQKISEDMETVGGLIDVAVISKRDGFKWIKKKQYFKTDLNP
jgi:hypothetical protein